MFDNIIISLGSGIAASFTLFLLFYWWRPKLEVAEVLAYDSNKEKIIVKVVNKTKVPIHDITYELLKCNNRGDGIVYVEACKPAKSSVATINKYNDKDEEAKYALRISYNECDNEIKKWIDNGEGNYLLFNITAKHSFSGGIKTITKKYVSADIKNGRFETKLSMNVLSIN